MTDSIIVILSSSSAAVSWSVFCWHSASTSNSPSQEQCLEHGEISATSANEVSEQVPSHISDVHPIPFRLNRPSPQALPNFISSNKVCWGVLCVNLARPVI